MKNAFDILTGIALNLLIVLGSMAILTILILPVHEHGISFHLLYQCHKVSSVRVFYLLRFIPTHLLFLMQV